MRPEETFISSSDHDFLSREDWQWIARCRILAALLFLGLLAGITLYDDGERTVTTLPSQAPGAAMTAAAPADGTAPP